MKGAPSLLLLLQGLVVDGYHVLRHRAVDFSRLQDTALIVAAVFGDRGLANAARTGTADGDLKILAAHF